jgi:hypothetical protein
MCSVDSVAEALRLADASLAFLNSPAAADLHSGSMPLTLMMLTGTGRRRRS